MAGKPRGGLTHHRPDCACRPCAAQRRQKEALALGDRGGPITVPVRRTQNGKALNADLPPIQIQGKTGRDRILQFIAIRNEQPDLTHADIARKLGLAPRTLYTLISKATREGWLVFSDPVSRIENEIIPKVVDNLSHYLDLKDKQVTIETAKGTIFRKYADEQGIHDMPQTVLALKIEKGDGPDIKVAIGSIVGKPREIED
jgi:hypothetical protein